jgi:HSP20 family protein
MREGLDTVNIQTYDPFDELRRIQDRIGGIFGAFPTVGTNMEMPTVDILQQGNDIIVTADLPGVDKNDIKIDVRNDNILDITAQKRTETVEQSRTAYLRRERRFMGYARSIMLPAPVDKTKAKATYNNGVLTVTLPMMQKPEEQKKSEIRVT